MGTVVGYALFKKRTFYDFKKKLIMCISTNEKVMAVFLEIHKKKQDQRWPRIKKLQSKFAAVLHTDGYEEK